MGLLQTWRSGALVMAKPGVLVVRNTEPGLDDVLQLLENYRAAVIGKELSDPRTTRLVEQFRMSGKLRVIWRGSQGSAKEMLRALKRNQQLMAMQILVISGLSREVVRERGELPPNSHYLEKPINFDWLHGYVTALLVANRKWR